MSFKFIRKTKEEKTIVAICYDFDKTLTPDDMLVQGLIQSMCDETVNSFWKESWKMARNNEMESDISNMYRIMKRAKYKLTKQNLKAFGAKVKLYAGVEEWFPRIKQYGVDKGIIIEHYIISSGLKEMIEGSSLAQHDTIEKIFASSFLYDEKGLAIWPAQVINYTNKTQFLFRISKGVLDINDPAVNDYFSPEEIRVPLKNFIYIGDSDTDVPCMKLVNLYGGHSIGVFDNDKLDKSKVYKMLRYNRIRYFAPADYSCGSELDSLVKTIIDSIAANGNIVTDKILEKKHLDCVNELEKVDNLVTKPRDLD